MAHLETSSRNGSSNCKSQYETGGICTKEAKQFVSKIYTIFLHGKWMIIDLEEGLLLV
jgi:hypothetical protein